MGITGTGPAAGIIGVMEIHSPATYGYVTKKSYAAVRYTIPDDPEAREAGRIALAAWRLLGRLSCGTPGVATSWPGGLRPRQRTAHPLAVLQGCS